MIQTKSQWFWEYMVSPKEKYKFSHQNDNFLYFEQSEITSYNLAYGKTPILIEGGIFDVISIINREVTTQNPGYGDTSLLKNYIRRHILPSLTFDSHIKNRYLKLIENYKGKEVRVLIIGAGQKSSYYKEIFGEKTVTSDVHLQYDVDIVFDAHHIPFENETFDIILAQQVLEHCIRPWQVADEFQRVVKKNGLIQIEVPFCFPFHSAPFDFYRYTYSGLRSLFKLCTPKEITVPEGPFSSIAIIISNALTESSNNRYIRIFWLIISRFLLWPLKYFDFLIARKVKNQMSLPKGFTVTFEKDGTPRSDELLICEIKSDIELDIRK